LFSSFIDQNMATSNTFDNSLIDNLTPIINNSANKSLGPIQRPLNSSLNASGQTNINNDSVWRHHNNDIIFDDFNLFGQTTTTRKHNLDNNNVNKIDSLNSLWPSTLSNSLSSTQPWNSVLCDIYATSPSLNDFSETDTNHSPTGNHQHIKNIWNNDFNEK
jgi:hypothetical protein